MVTGHGQGGFCAKVGKFDWIIYSGHCRLIQNQNFGNQFEKYKENLLHYNHQTVPNEQAGGDSGKRP